VSPLTVAAEREGLLGPPLADPLERLTDHHAPVPEVQVVLSHLPCYGATGGVVDALRRRSGRIRIGGSMSDLAAIVVADS